MLTNCFYTKKNKEYGKINKAIKYEKLIKRNVIIIYNNLSQLQNFLRPFCHLLTHESLISISYNNKFNESEEWFKEFEKHNSYLFRGKNRSLTLVDIHCIINRNSYDPDHRSLDTWSNKEIHTNGYVILLTEQNNSLSNYNTILNGYSVIKKIIKNNNGACFFHLVFKSKEQKHTKSKGVINYNDECYISEIVQKDEIVQLFLTFNAYTDGNLEITTIRNVVTNILI